MNTVALKTMIYTYLKTISSHVYYGQKPVTASVYPYIIFELDASNTDDNQVLEQFELSVQIYDNDQYNTGRIDVLAGSIDGDGNITAATGLHRKHYRTATLSTDMYRTRRDEVAADNDGVSYIELSYDVYTYLS